MSRAGTILPNHARFAPANLTRNSRTRQDHAAARTATIRSHDHDRCAGDHASTGDVRGRRNLLGGTAAAVRVTAGAGARGGEERLGRRRQADADHPRADDALHRPDGRLRVRCGGVRLEHRRYDPHGAGQRGRLGQGGARSMAAGRKRQPADDPASGRAAQYPRRRAASGRAGARAVGYRDRGQDRRRPCQVESARRRPARGVAQGDRDGQGPQARGHLRRRLRDRQGVRELSSRYWYPGDRAAVVADQEKKVTFDPPKKK